MKTITVASMNPAKIDASLGGFEQMFPDCPFCTRGIAVPSQVSGQPRSDGETLAGAENRAKGARDKFPEADYWLGIEGGVEGTEDGMSGFAWVVILSANIMGRSRTGTFLVPPPVANLIRQGKELGEAADVVYRQSGSKSKGGAIEVLTGGIVDRTALYQHAVQLALVPFKNESLFKDCHPASESTSLPTLQ